MPYFTFNRIGMLFENYNSPLNALVEIYIICLVPRFENLVKISNGALVFSIF